MKTVPNVNNRPNLAFFGSDPLFSKPIPTGQLYFPDWDRYESAMRGIFKRQYYNNNGPLHQELEFNLKHFFGVKHVICVGNATIGLMMVADALELSGKVVLPAFTFVASAQSLSWAGLEPVFCDVDIDTHMINLESLDRLIGDDVSAVMGVNLWGGASQPKELEAFAKSRNLKLYFDSAHAFGCEVDGLKIGSFGEAEVFSFHATKILSATEGGCICTNDDSLASRLKSIRPSYGESTVSNVVRVANARMSEAQAAIALLSLEDLQTNLNNNKRLYTIYLEHMQSISGIKIVPATGVSSTNYQYLVCIIDEDEFGLSRDLLINLLHSENVLARRYFYPGLHRVIPYSDELPKTHSRLLNTDKLSSTCLQLPLGALVNTLQVKEICLLIHRIGQNSEAIKSQHEK